MSLTFVKCQSKSCVKPVKYPSTFLFFSQIQKTEANMGEVSDFGGIAIKSEPLDITENPVIPKEFLRENVLPEEPPEDLIYFDQTEVENTRRCLENMRLIVKDFETQLDWHLQQYMMLRNVFKKDDSSKKQDPMTISQLTQMFATFPEGNKNFIKRRPASKTKNNNKQGKKKATDESESEDEEDEDEEEFSEGSEEFDEDEDFADDASWTEDDPAPKKAKKRARKPRVKDEIEEEFHELEDTKEEPASEEEAAPPAKKTKKSPAKKPAAKRGRAAAKDKKVSVKDEGLEREELLEKLESKAIMSVDDLDIDPETAIFVLKADNLKDFDFAECVTSTIIITFESLDNLPEFVFGKAVLDHILDDSIMLVLKSVFEQHLDGQS